MVEVSLLVTLVIVLVSAIVIFKVAKGVIQGVLLASAVLSILTAVAGGFIVKDAFELRDNFQAQDNILLFSDKDGKLITVGAVVKGQSGNVKPLAASELEKLNSLFAKKDYESMRGKNYKLIIVKESLLPLLPNLTDTTSTGNAESKAALMVSLLATKISQDPLFLILEYKKGSVIIYPETPVFKVIKIFPTSLFRSIAEKMFQQVKEAPDQVSSLVKGQQQDAVVK